MLIGTFSFRVLLVCAVVVAFPLTFQSLYAAGPGTIKGHVIDKTTNEPLIGANVMVLNTSLGAASNIDGLITINAVPAGLQTLKISYIGYQTITVEVTVPENGVVEQEFRLSPQAIHGEEVVVTVQARGQNEAINQQLASDKIANMVSSARIQELPDANAAESVGRLPGVSLVRSGGEAKQVVIRGLEPKYNSITIDGISLPATNSGDRGTDLSMISSTSLEGIQIFKTVTPDMDAGAIGGSVNFDIRHAKSGAEGAPSFSFIAEGGYKGLVYSLGDYKFVASGEKRFLNDKFGVFVQGIVQRQNLTNDQMSGSYSNSKINSWNSPDSIQMLYSELLFIKSIQNRYDATVTLDYKLPDGEISLLNLVSRGKTNADTYSERYPTSTQGGSIFFGVQRETFDLHVVSNILSYKQSFGTYTIHAKLSHAYSDNIAPYSWYTNFTSSTGTTVPFGLTPSEAIKAGQGQVNVLSMPWTTLKGWNSFTKQDDRQMSLDIEKRLNLSDKISATVKAGGTYKYTSRYYNYDQADGIMNILTGTQPTIRAYLVTQLPFLQNAPFNWDPTGSNLVQYFGFIDPSVNFGNYINGKYSMRSSANIDVLDKVMHILKDYRAGTTSSPAQPVFDPNYVESRYQDYSGHEIRTAVYFMTTVNVGSWLTIIPGVRYQELKTSYSALHFNNYVITNTSQKWPDSSVTADNTHRYWLPDVSIKIIPSDVIDFRLAYTNTLAYPDYQSFVPKWAYNASYYIMYWNNTGLLPERSQNYDVQMSYHNNYVGLFAIGGFLKQIDNEIYDPGDVYLSRATAQSYPFKDLFTASVCTLYTYVNNPFRVKVWGIETEWQTHFWYLPKPFNNLVLNVNYTHIFSAATFEKVRMKLVGRITVPVDTLYTDKLYQQPSDIVNLSVGYHYKKFSILASMIYQSEVFNKPNFWWMVRSDKEKYLRWDLVVKQGLPWFNTEVYCNMNNLNNETDLYKIRKNDLPTSENSYGFTINFGVRWDF